MFREVSNEQNQSCKSPFPVINNTGIKVLSEACSSLIDCNGNMTQTQHNQGIEMTLLERLSSRNMQAANDSGIVLGDLFDSGANNNTGSLLGQLHQTFEEPSSLYHLGNYALSREQVDVGIGEQFMCLNSGEGNFQHIGTTSPRASVSFSSFKFGIVPVHKESEADLLSETSNDSDDICIIEGNPMENVNGGESDDSPPRERVYTAMGFSPYHNIENEELVSTQEEFVGPSSQIDRDEEKALEDDLGMVEKTSGGLGDNCDDDQKEEAMDEEDEKRIAKRRRLSSTGEV